MKRLLLFAILFSFISFSFAQEVQFPPSILAAGGGSSSNALHISKWRIGRVNVFNLDSKDLKSDKVITQTNALSKESWNILAYPNPVTQNLNIRFELENPAELGIELTDISGRKVIIRKKQLVSPDENIQLDLTSITPALYLVHIISDDKAIKKVFKISKQ